jgi:hypothetical protein
MMIYLFSFIYFFADPILCQGESLASQNEVVSLQDIGYISQIEKVSVLKDSLKFSSIQASKAKKDFFH